MSDEIVYRGGGWPGYVQIKEKNKLHCVPSGKQRLWVLLEILNVLGVSYARTLLEMMQIFLLEMYILLKKMRTNLAIPFA
ncbi:MAG: hypothetical protein QM426_03735 [Euryarchaeota archaeon]|nr:hypothetical protein [Euryarchaeota archaeon]